MAGYAIYLGMLHGVSGSSRVTRHEAGVAIRRAATGLRGMRIVAAYTSEVLVRRLAEIAMMPQRSSVGVTFPA